MSGTCVVVVLLGLAALCSLPAARAQPPFNFDVADEKALDGLYELLAQHGALDGHALARKSVRSPSRRLRFGRRSDPDMPPQAPLDEMAELMSLRVPRAPVRLRFGRRSVEGAVPQEFNDALEPERAPAKRLRWGRRFDTNMFLMPYEPAAAPKEVKATGSVDDRQAD